MNYMSYINYNNSNMFCGHNESISSSDRTQKLKNKHLYINRHQQNGLNIKNNNLIHANSYENYYNAFKGFFDCKKATGIKETDENCFLIWLDDDIDLMTINNIDDFYISKVNYEFINDPSDNYIQTNPESNLSWPIKKKGNCYYNIPDIYTFFDNHNPKSITIFAKNLKYGLRMSNYN